MEKKEKTSKREILKAFMEKNDYTEDLAYMSQFYKDAINDDLFAAARAHLKPNIRKREYKELKKMLK